MNKPITLCDRCDIQFRCLLNYDGIPCRKNRTVEPNNADRIRAMTDEELADWLAEVAGWIAPYEGRVHPLLDWLKTVEAE